LIIHPSYFDLFHMISHLPGTNIINIGLLIFGLIDPFVYTLIKFPLIELHLQHIQI